MTNTPADIAARVAGRLGLTPEDPRVLDATDAAIHLATSYCYGDTPTVIPPAQLDLDEPLHVQGLVQLGVRLYLGPESPAGVLESDSYSGTVVPGDPMAEVSHLFDPSRDVSSVIGIA